MGRPTNVIVVTEHYRQLAQTFYQYQKRLGYVPESYKARFNYLNEFLQWLECKGTNDITSVTAPEISRYYEYIGTRPSKKDGGSLSSKTTHSHMRIVKDLFEMLLQQRQIKINPCSILKFYYPKDEAGSTRNIATQQEIQQLYEVTGTAQERAILSLAYGCGLRATELENCNIQDIRLREKILIVPKGKGNKKRIVPLSGGVIKDLSDYYYHEREALTQGRDYALNIENNQPAFMLHSRGGRMQDETYNKYLKRIINRTDNKALQEKEITIHSLRHSIATHLLEQGIPVEQVRLFLGHSQLETTQIYTHINQHQLKKMIHDDTQTIFAK
ncbi:MAG: tyrosine-type recombinase/integrase [Chitinophagaceae bacterium]|nr:tyrosine-type recombinase/integrase [Chitinophagaceae bacterium]